MVGVVQRIWLEWVRYEGRIHVSIAPSMSLRTVFRTHDSYYSWRFVIYFAQRRSADVCGEGCLRAAPSVGDSRARINCAPTPLYAAGGVSSGDRVRVVGQTRGVRIVHHP